MKSINFFGTHVSCLTQNEELKQIKALVEDKISTYVVYSDVHEIVMSKNNPFLRNVINSAYMVSPDGKPLSVIAKLKGAKYVERCSGPDMMLKIIEQGLESNCKNYFYGSTKETLELLEKELKKTYPTINIVGMYSPPFRPLTEEEDKEVVNEINHLKPDYIWVALGAPKQEIWMYEHRFAFGQGIMFGVGAAFQFHAKIVKRAPKWMQNAGIEWLYRDFQEPKRLFKRYLKTIPLFLFYVITKHISIDEEKVLNRSKTAH